MLGKKRIGNWDFNFVLTGDEPPWEGSEESGGVRGVRRGLRSLEGTEGSGGDRGVQRGSEESGGEESGGGQRGMERTEESGRFWREMEGTEVYGEDRGVWGVEGTEGY